jgi:hypothetical protein
MVHRGSGSSRSLRAISLSPRLVLCQVCRVFLEPEALVFIDYYSNAGYYATVLTIERFGRKKIQIMGFLMEALFRAFLTTFSVFETTLMPNLRPVAILAGKFHSLKTAPFIVCFALLQARFFPSTCQPPLTHGRSSFSTSGPTPPHMCAFFYEK